MINPGLQALASHWLRNPWQLATLLAGIALSTALWSGVQAINAEARASYAAAADIVGAADLRSVVKTDATTITTQEYVDLKRLGWPVSPILSGHIDVDGVSVRIVGIDPLTFPARLPGSTLFDGTLSGLISDDPIGFAHPDDIERLSALNLELRPDPARPIASVLADISVAQRLLGQGARLDRLLLADTKPLGLADLPAEYKLAEQGVQTDVARLTDSFHLNLTAFGLLSFAVGIFIVYGAVGLAFEQRRGVFRTLRALGVPLRTLAIFLVVELGVMALLAGAAGIAFGYVIAAALLPDVAATLRGLYGADVAGQLQLRASWWVSGFGMALAGTAVAGAAAIYKLAYMPLLSFNHPRAMSIAAARNYLWLALCGLALLLAGILFAALANGLIAGFGLLGCLLIGTAFCLPWVLAQGLAFSEQRSKSALLQWFWADSRQQLPGLSMALMALLLAMAANIGVLTMVSSFRVTFSDYLDQRLASELYVRAENGAQAAELTAFLVPQVEALLPIVSIDTRIGGLPAEIFGMQDHATYRENWPLLSAVPQVWDKLAEGKGALASEQLARRSGWKIGDNVVNGDRLIGIYSDYGNSEGQMVLGAELFATRYPDVEALRFGVRSNQPEKVRAALQEQFSLTEEALIDQIALKDFSLQVFERTFAVTGALNILTLSVAGLAIFISLLTLAAMRLPQLAPVWALGLTPETLSRIELMRALCLAVLTSIVAVPVGLLLAWVLLAFVNVEAFGWRLPMYIFPLEYLKLGFLTICAAFLAALWPAVRLARTEPQALLKVFSNER